MSDSINKSNEIPETSPVVLEKKRPGRPKKILKEGEVPEKKKIKANFTDEELKIIDINLLGKFSDRELEKKWGIHRIRILRLRNSLKIPACKYNYKQAERMQKILEFLKINEKNIITIQDFHKMGIFMIEKKLLTKDAIKEIAEKNNIKVTFKNDKEYEHSQNGYIKGCRCDICRLAIRIYMKYTQSVSVRFCNFLANEYIELYKQDQTKFHRQFYSFVEEEIEKSLELEKPEKENEIVFPGEIEEELNQEKLVDNDVSTEPTQPLRELSQVDRESIRKEFLNNNRLRQELLKAKYKK